MAAHKFKVDDIVRFSGTDALLIVRKCRKQTREYLVQRGNDSDRVGWVFGIYLELVEPAKRSASSARMTLTRAAAGS
jgi:hypothetical protein